MPPKRTQFVTYYGPRKSLICVIKVTPGTVSGRPSPAHPYHSVFPGWLGSVSFRLYEASLPLELSEARSAEEQLSGTLSIPLYL